MMRYALLEDAPSPESKVDEHAFKDSVSAAADGDEVHPITEVVVNSCHDLNVDGSRGNMLSIKELKHEEI